ncbi:MAG: DUF4168 domain-containing protein [Alkalispirochaetaceae bacterium]
MKDYNTRGSGATRRSIFIGFAMIMLLSFFGVASVAAQSGMDSDAPEVSGEELEQFAAALEEVETIRQDMVETTQGAVADSSLDESRFQELYRAETGGPAPSSAPSDSEEEEFEALMGELEEIQQESNDQMVEAVEDEGLDVQRFNRIAQAIQQDPELQERFEELEGS